MATTIMAVRARVPDPIMALLPITAADLVALTGAAAGPDRPWDVTHPTTVLVVDLDARADPDGPPAWTLHPGIGAVVAGTTTRDPAAHPARAGCDVVVARDGPDLAAVEATVAEHPRAAVSLALLLRGSERRSVDEGLHAESAVYSTLQAGPEFAAWRASRAVRQRTDEPAEAVRIERDGHVLTLTLTRPAARNALNAALRDQLLAGLAVAGADASITEVHLRGDGDSFCSGGDLDEFGSAPDPSTAHLVRLTASIGRLIDELRDRTIAHLHGACAGSGIELPAFAGRVVAAPDTTITLPEVTLGLVPGAGGTVSLPRRIGRHRTALLALAGLRLDAPTALAWGLVDAVEAR